MEINLLDAGFLAGVATDIESSDNKLRKLESYRAYDIFNGNQHRYAIDALCRDYPIESVKAMRTVTSINFARRIVDVEGAVYKHAPYRHFNASNDMISDALNLTYSKLGIDQKNKLANKFFKLDEQCASMIVPNPATGCIGIRNLQNWQYDVIPHPLWPEMAMAYVIPVSNNPRDFSARTRGDGYDQRISDVNDGEMANKRYILWSNEYNFMFNGSGEILTPQDQIENPIGVIPIVDISGPKSNSFINTTENSLSRFTIDFLCQLSDHATNIQMQGYAQAVLSATEVPKDIMVGPQRILFLKKKKNADPSEQPEFQFVNPNPDIQGSMDSLMGFLRMFLSSRGNKTNVVTSGQQQMESATSGLERLLKMIEQHDMSLDDFALFEQVERKQFEIIRLYHNYLQSISQDVFPVSESARGPEIPDDVEFDIEFYEPQMVETNADKQSRLNERLENGTLSRIRYVMELDGVDEQTARRLLQEADEFGALSDIQSS